MTYSKSGVRLAVVLLLVGCAHHAGETSVSTSAPSPVAPAASERARGDATVSTTTLRRADVPVALNEGDVRAAVTRAHHAFAGLDEGKNADYIPALAKVDPKLFGITLVTTSGEIYEVGDVQHTFSIQSVSKVFTLSRAMEELGIQTVEKKIGTDATGEPFNSIVAIERNEVHRAGNPFVNPGAIATVSLVPARTSDERWSKIIGTLHAFAGRALRVDQEVYASESETNTRNRAISWLLKAYDVIPGDPMEALDVYTRQCSVAVNAHDLAVMGATLANGGKNPVSGARVIAPENAARVLSVMLTTGLYETSGAWSVATGVPAKSGVGGGVVAVVPGRFAIGTFSPRLDGAGNSVRGQRAIESIVKDLGGNVFVAQPMGRDPEPRPQR